jgi:hypothetical protein
VEKRELVSAMPLRGLLLLHWDSQALVLPKPETFRLLELLLV